MSFDEKTNEAEKDGKKVDKKLTPLNLANISHKQRKAVRIREQNL